MARGPDDESRAGLRKNRINLKPTTCHQLLKDGKTGQRLNTGTGEEYDAEAERRDRSPASGRCDDPRWRLRPGASGLVARWAKGAEPPKRIHCPMKG